MPKEFRRRNFKIIKSLLEKHGYSTNCMRCEAVLSGDAQREHTAGCRSRLEAAMEGDPENRDRRFHRRQHEEPGECRPQENASEKEAVNEQVQQENEPNLEQEKVRIPEIDDEMEVDKDLEAHQDVLYGNDEIGAAEVEDTEVIESQ